MSGSMRTIAARPLFFALGKTIYLPFSDKKTDQQISGPAISLWKLFKLNLSAASSDGETVLIAQVSY